MKKHKTPIFVISGPSGCGKTTLIKHLLKDRALKRCLSKSVSFTTRPRRKSERNRKDYFFISGEEFNKLLKRKKILEWTKYLSYYYGTPKDYVDGKLKNYKSVVLCLDAKGARNIKRNYSDRTVTIFILPPKIKALEQRIRERSKLSGENNLFSRLGLAKKEISQAKRYDYKIINNDFQSALKELKNIIKTNVECIGGVAV